MRSDWHSAGEILPEIFMGKPCPQALHFQGGIHSLGPPALCASMQKNVLRVRGFWVL